jgi:histone deacetylase complex regulatory component SIN3
VDYNMKAFPFFRFIMIREDAHGNLSLGLSNKSKIDLNRLQHSYVEIPENCKLDTCSGALGDPICEQNLNSKYIGLPPFEFSEIEALTTNQYKLSLIKVL